MELLSRLVSKTVKLFRHVFAWKEPICSTESVSPHLRVLRVDGRTGALGPIVTTLALQLVRHPDALGAFGSAWATSANRM